MSRKVSRIRKENVGLKWLLTKVLKKIERIHLSIIGFIILGCGVVFIVARKFDLIRYWTELLKSTAFLRLLAYPLVISALILLMGIIFRTVLWLQYRPQVLARGERIEWPYLSIVMAAFNEEDLVTASIDSVFASKYPSEKIEVICVDDGSTDSTGEKLRIARIQYGAKLNIISFRTNLGKRKALYEAFKRSRGEIIVTVDTDGKLGRSALRNIIIPILHDAKTGAVAGRVAVLNDKESFFSRMLSTRYALSFDFGRGYQSVYGGVFCCPGALTAYRKDLVASISKEWLNQKFLNVPSVHGEDRALTTLVLRSGFMVRYQSNALVYTRVPTSFSQINRMYLRWTRSYLRESVLFAKFMFLPYRKKNRLFPICDFVFENLIHPFQWISLFVLTYSFINNPTYILRQVAFLFILSFFLSLYYLRTHRSLAFFYGIPFAFLSVLFQWWIVPFSALTLKNQSWLTR